MPGTSQICRPGFLLIAALAWCGAAPLRAQIFTVTSLADSGPGTLRDQLIASHSTPNATINFGVSGTITLASPLPLQFGRRNGTTIDGGNQITISGGGNVQPFVVPGLLVIRIVNLTIADGKANLGGALVNNGYLTVKNVRFRNNTAIIGGGAIWAIEGILTADSCTFDGNSADPATGVGGAIYTTAAGRLYVENSTFTNNRAAQGGAVLHDSSDGVFYNATIAGNTALSGGGLFLGRFSVSGATFDLKNTIVSGNTGGNCATSLPSPVWHDLGGNITFPDNTCPGIVVDPKLGPLAANGGPTPTMALLAGSAAVDHALNCLGLSSTPLLTDQRGVSRPQGPACDSGAYEKSYMAFGGFLPPIANRPLVNNENAGRAIPITFSVGGFLGMNVIAPGYPASRPISCATGQPTGPLVPIDTPGKSGLSFDNFQNRYTIVWKTEKSWDGQCRELFLRLSDGIDHTALFRFR